MARSLPAKLLVSVIALAGITLSSFAAVDARVRPSLSVLNASTIGEAVFGETGAAIGSGGPPAGVFGLYAFGDSEGAGVFGKSVNGPGVDAETSGATSPALYARNPVKTAGAGPAILAIGHAGEAIHAISNDNNGIVGISRSSTDESAAGVSGSLIDGKDTDSGALGTSYAGVLGTASKYGSGVLGLSSHGHAVVGLDEAKQESGLFTSQAALYGESTAGPGLVAYSLGGHAPDGYMSDRHAAIGGESFKGSGLSVFSSESAGAKIGNGSRYDTLYLRDDYDDANYAIQVYSGHLQGDALLLDNSGNLTIEGAFEAQNGAMARTRNPGSDRTTYAAQSTQATVEDVGSAELVDGRATVALAPDFRETIDGSPAYAVFLTPYGDNRGLYVAQRTSAGFIVRESQGGRSTMPFDYRIVARQFGASPERLPHHVDRARGALPAHHETESANSEVFGPHPNIVAPAGPPAL